MTPLQEKLEDWKKAVAQLDKDHSKGMPLLSLLYIVLYLNGLVTSLTINPPDSNKNIL